MGHLYDDFFSGLSQQLNSYLRPRHLYSQHARSQARTSILMRVNVKVIWPYKQPCCAALRTGILRRIQNERSEHSLAAFNPSPEKVYIAHEVHHKLRSRIVKNLLGRPDLFNAGLIHYDHAVGNFQRFFLIMRHKNAGDMHFIVQPSQPAPQALPDLGIKRAKRFIQQQHLRFDGESPG